MFCSKRGFPFKTISGISQAIQREGPAGKVRSGVRITKNLEARVGIEPTHKGFADLSLTTWVPRLWPLQPNFHAENTSRRGATGVRTENLERETGVDPATSTLARSRSTTELLPLVITFYSIGYALPI